MSDHRFPLPVSHSRARFYQLHRSSFWFLLAIAFAAGALIEGIAFWILVHQARAAYIEKGTP